MPSELSPHQTAAPQAPSVYRLPCGLSYGLVRWCLAVPLKQIEATRLDMCERSVTSSLLVNASSTYAQFIGIGDVHVAQEDTFKTLSEELPRENVFGHTHKVFLFQEACAEMRTRRPCLRILDLGCGSGYAVTRFLGEPGDEILGLDLYEPNIQYAKQHFERNGLRFECRSAASLTDSKQTFDVVVLADILEHLENPLSVVRECKRLLVSDGLLLVTIPNGYGPFEIESAISRVPVLGYLLLRGTGLFARMLNNFGPLKGKWTEALASTPTDLPYNLESSHIHFFSRRALHELMNSAGFRVTESKNLSFLCGPFTNTIFNVSARFCRWNVAVACDLPPSVVSGWFFKCLPDTDAL